MRLGSLFGVGFPRYLHNLNPNPAPGAEKQWFSEYARVGVQ